MKNVKQLMVAVSSLMLVTFTSCKKSTTDTTPVNTTTSNISKIEHAGDYSEFSYNADGSIKRIVSKLTDGTVTGDMNFVYENNKIKEANIGTTKLKYTYIGALVTKVETVNSAGTVMHKNEFAYINALPAEMVEYWSNGTGGLRPVNKATFTYNNAGNITKSEEFDYINNAWVKTWETTFTEYDTKKNTIISAENFAYLPNIKLCVNNPLKEELKNNLGSIVETVIHSYTYDNSERPTQRSSTRKIPGATDNVETTKFYY